MRIGIRTTPRTSGGGAVFAQQLTRTLHSHPRVAAVTTFVLGPEGAHAEPSTVAVPVPGGAVARRLKGDRALAQAIAAHPVDVLLCPGTEVSRVANVPSVMWPLTVAPFEQAALDRLGGSLKAAARWRLLRESIRRNAAHADAFVFSSHYARALYCDDLPGIKGAPSTVIHPGPSLFADDDATPPVPGARPYVLFVSHLYPYKMVVEAVEGFARAVRRTGTDHDLVIAGNAVDETYRQQVLATAARYDVSDRVKLLGEVPPGELPDLYRNADVFLFPSISENAGSYALIDAFAMGTPVISSSTSSMPEICQDAARYFDPRDPEQLGTELAMLLIDIPWRTRLRERGYERARALNSWEMIADMFVDFCGDQL